MPRRAQLVLGQDLVDAARAGRDAGPGEGDAEDLEQLLRGPVLTARAVHGDEGDFGPLRQQPLDQVAVGFQRQHFVAEPLQRVLDPRPGAQRDAPLQRATAFEDRDLQAPPSPLLRKGTTFSGSASSLREGAAGAAGCSPVSAP